MKFILIFMTKRTIYKKNIIYKINKIIIKIIKYFKIIINVANVFDFR